MIKTKYFDAEVNFPGDGEMEVETVLTKKGEDITNIIHDLEAWEAVDRLVAAEVKRRDRQAAEEFAAGQLDKVVGL